MIKFPEGENLKTLEGLKEHVPPLATRRVVMHAIKSSNATIGEYLGAYTYILDKDKVEDFIKCIPTIVNEFEIKKELRRMILDAAKI